jgi:hypothetical protein
MENQEIAARLETIYEQIKNYPTPIAGCDEQFNFLLEERDRLRNLLAIDQQQSVTVE